MLWRRPTLARRLSITRTAPARRLQCSALTSAWRSTHNSFTQVGVMTRDAAHKHDVALSLASIMVGAHMHFYSSSHSRGVCGDSGFTALSHCCCPGLQALCSFEAHVRDVLTPRAICAVAIDLSRAMNPLAAPYAKPCNDATSAARVTLMGTRLAAPAPCITSTSPWITERRCTVRSDCASVHGRRLVRQHNRRLRAWRRNQRHPS